MADEISETTQQTSGPSGDSEAPMGSGAEAATPAEAKLVEAAEAGAAEAPAEPAGETTPTADADKAEGGEAAEGDDSSSSSSSSSSSDEAEAATPEVDLEALQARVAKPAADARYQSTGKRKTSVARVILTPGDGFWINGRTLEDYFPRHSLRTAVMEPLLVAGAAGSYHIRTRIHGGGVSSQSGALRQGIAKALAEIDPQLRTQLKSRGFLKLDARQVERKKAGLKKARKKPQFSKR